MSVGLRAPKGSRRLWAVFLLGLALRLSYIHVPLVEVASDEQMAIASVARSFFEQMFVPSFSLLQEQGLYAFFLGGLYQIFAGAHEWIARFAGISLNALSLVPLYQLVKNYHGKNAAVWAVFVFFLSPLSIIYSRTLLPDAASVCMGLYALWFAEQYVRKARAFYGLAVWVFLAFAVGLRFTAVSFVVPIVYLFHRRSSKPTAWAFVHFISLLACLVGAYLMHFRLPIVDVQPLWSAPFWQKFLAHCFGKLLTPLGFVLVIRSLLCNRKTEISWLYPWFFACLSVAFLSANLTMQDKYYLFPLLAVCACFLGIELGKGNLGLPNQIPSWVKTLLDVFLAFSIMLQIATAYTISEQDFYLRKAGEDLQNYADKEDQVIATRSLYYCNRLGWVLNFHPKAKGDELREAMQEYVRRGAKYFVLSQLREYDKYPSLVGYVIDNFEEIVVEKGYRIYRVKSQ